MHTEGFMSEITSCLRSASNTSAKGARGKKTEFGREEEETDDKGDKKDEGGREEKNPRD